ncbi:hypothetical protein [Candidatus Nitrospira nitrificans]|uniref:Uncharacterized protein n=1 Tax=Candidatus Nitrospira nitrificans TaxID=1742973 RepID=A0A0S4LP37_9BACT|nr:hypothetical protein [Candidatus Nitrospira nitrificans]CUS39347.1 conserved hypothetical protein [Candidatus Nitrospira nitrificans]
MDGIGTGNQRLLDMVNIRRKLYLDKPELFFPWRKPCIVNALLVVDGLDFGMGDFGLSAFVDILKNDGRSYVKFNLTLAHLDPNAGNTAVQAGAPGIARSIKGFVFDDPNHFTSTMYDEVWMFGVRDNFHTTPDGTTIFANRRSNPARYPADRLGDGELDALTAHMNRGGGIFATGDHGTLGKALCGSIDRVRNMRYWDDFGSGETSMGGPRRNDSNQTGHDAGSQFSDQSDDIPQRLDLKLYSTPVGIFREARYPHPVMCSRLGRIDVFPDHPHEGECREPSSLSGTCRDGTPEYPTPHLAAPEVVATGHVPAGNRASSRNGASLKDATQAHLFGVVSTYDGHRVSKGRVVCDSTWHHFVNVNLIGVVEGGIFDDFDYPGHPGTPGTHTSKHDGFLSSAAGRAALDKIKEYYVNVGVWIAPADKISCMNSRLWWELIFADRIVEATLTEFTKPWTEISLHQLYLIGVHARDVIGRQAGTCQSLAWILPEIDLIWIELRPWIDPWGPLDPKRVKDPVLPWFDLQPLLDIAVGGAVAALREAFPAVPTADALDGRSIEIVRKATSVTFGRALKALGNEVKSIDGLMASGRKRIS